MPCPKCLEDPNYHSFTQIGTMNDVRVYYTLPSKVINAKDSSENTANFKLHLDELKGTKWIWIFDCHEMESTQYSSITFMFKVLRVLPPDQINAIEGLWFIRQSSWMQSMLSLVQQTFNVGVLSN